MSYTHSLDLLCNFFSVCVCVATFQSQDQIEEERERVNASILTLGEELESCRDQGEQWKAQLDATAQELRDTTQELVSISRNVCVIMCLILTHMK